MRKMTPYLIMKAFAEEGFYLKEGEAKVISLAAKCFEKCRKDERQHKPLGRWAARRQNYINRLNDIRQRRHAPDYDLVYTETLPILGNTSEDPVLQFKMPSGAVLKVN